MSRTSTCPECGDEVDVSVTFKQGACPYCGTALEELIDGL